MAVPAGPPPSSVQHSCLQAATLLGLAFVAHGRLHDFLKSHPRGILLSKEAVLMNPNTEKLRKKYMDNPPEGMTSGDIRRMSEDDLLDMDYFLQ